jgi:DNA-binding XRE family transcriptional regulator
VALSQRNSPAYGWGRERGSRKLQQERICKRGFKQDALGHQLARGGAFGISARQSCRCSSQLREYRYLSQGDIEHRSGVLRCYISRVENDHTTPSLETLEKLARAVEIPIYQFF